MKKLNKKQKLIILIAIVTIIVIIGIVVGANVTDIRTEFVKHLKIERCRSKIYDQKIQKMRRKLLFFAFLCK